MARSVEIVSEEDLLRLREELARQVNEARVATLTWLEANRRQVEARQERLARDQAREDAAKRLAAVETEIDALRREIEHVLDLTEVERSRDLARLRLAELDSRLAELRRFAPGTMMPPPPDEGIFL